MVSQITRFTLPVGAAFLFQGTVFADSVSSTCPQINKPDPAAVYSPPPSSKCCPQKKQRECKDTELEKVVMIARKELGPYMCTITQYTNAGIQKVNACYEKLMDNLCYLRTGAPQEMKIGTIVAGGLTGMLLGIRGGFMKKIVFGSLGAGGGSYLAYPYETEKYSKKYTAVAYNFISGPPASHKSRKCDGPAGRLESEKKERNLGGGANWVTSNKKHLIRMCDNRNKCQKKGGPPENVPAWLTCPPKLKERNYPAPSGIEILPISVGGRNGGGGGSKQAKCGQCGQDNQQATAKPKASADCPMMKPRCPAGDGGAADSSSSGGGFFAKISSMFGGKEDSKLVEACKRLQLHVPDEQIANHRDVFNSHLVVRKDGYMAPFLTKVECQGSNDCTPEPDPNECECEDDDEEEYDEDEDCYEDEYEDEDEGHGGTKTIEIDGCKCTCECPEKEECVENKEGECIVEESSECMDPACKFFLEDPPQDKEAMKKKKKCLREEFNKIGKEADDCKTPCAALNSFIIRVQAPFSECTTNETCEQILSRLTTKKPQYPEPDVIPKKEEKQIELVVKEISVQEAPKSKKKCKCPEKKDKAIKSETCVPPAKEPVNLCPPDNPPPPPIVETPGRDECVKPSTNSELGTQTQPGEVVTPPGPLPGEISANPPGLSPQPDGVTSPSQSQTPDVPVLATCEDIPPPPNDCETLSEEELLKKPFREIKCGCPKMCEDPNSNTLTELSVWTPPPPPPCAACGAEKRGDTENCFLCSITRRVRSGQPEVCTNVEPRITDSLKPDPSSCTPTYLPDGSIEYRGGMCVSLCSQYLWHIAKRTPPGGFFDRFTGECGEEARLQARNGSKASQQDCSCNEENRPAYKGGMCADKCKSYLWCEKSKEPESVSK